MKIEFEMPEDLYARFMRTFDISQVDGVGKDPGERVLRVVKVHIGQWELQEEERHQKEMVQETMQKILAQKKEELGI